ncbi:MAG: isoleucine--tRNA ligase [Planctomycetota bacterium]
MSQQTGERPASDPKPESSKPGPGKPKGDKSPYRKTLNLPKTSFPMRANLVQNEPASLKRWKGSGLYARLRRERADRERFVFHDGPPYANGPLHMGHLMNKCLKDFVVRSRGMMGMNVPYVPGWDCHGLPIEHRVMQDLEASGKADKLRELPEETYRLAVRRECEKYAHSQVKLQSGQMQRLLTMADYDEPYLTLHPAYEGATLEVLAGLVEQGLVFRALKPVHWSVANETALADAELEYQDRTDLSVYVDFECEDAAAVYRAFGLNGDDAPEARPSLMIWTTTPWTLPANLAVAVNEKFTYALVRLDGAISVLAEALVEQVTKMGKSEDVEVLATAPGSALLGLRYRSPLRQGLPSFELAQAGDEEKVYTVLAADYVTLEDGTGLVHTAPGHGVEDYQTGLREGLPIYCPVLADGTYDQTVPEGLAGRNIFEANDDIARRLEDSGHLFFAHKFDHSYPHDWRSKTPVIFRCTEQWFVGVDTPTKREGTSLRAMALSAADGGIRFLPEWGQNRMRGMLESRPDWCISRQRAWGLPIPAFFMPDGGVLMTAASVRAVAQAVREKGSDLWLTGTPTELLSHYDASADPDAPAGLDLETLTKGKDILDVWFESGSSWNAVMRERSGGADFPVELYLEGSDQHRGWFQTSLLPSLGVMGSAPYKAVLTHGFCVDREGHKLSKSKGHTIEDLFQTYGADVLRWWVASTPYEHDVKTDTELFDLSGESYRKVRNTLRFLLSNLDDFDMERDGVAADSLAATSIDAWALGSFDATRERVVQAFERYEFQNARRAIYDFCNDTLSATYLAAVKDRLYCDRPDSARRRQTQTAMWAITDGLARLMAPLLPHTADEAFRALRKVDPKDHDTCVHAAEFPGATGATADARWAAMMDCRHEALRAIEAFRSTHELDNPLDAGVTLPSWQEHSAAFDAVDLADLLGVSRVSVDEQATDVRVHDLRSEPRCERSWKRDGTVRERSDGGMLSDRDAEALGQ